MAEETTTRKTFRLDDDVARLLQQRKEKGSYGNTENDVVNRLLRNIPKQEAEILRQHNVIEEERRQKEEWATRARTAERELAAIRQALQVVGGLLLPAQSP